MDGTNIQIKTMSETKKKLLNAADTHKGCGIQVLVRHVLELEIESMLW
jgi:hypothetical protein